MNRDTEIGTKDNQTQWPIILALNTACLVQLLTSPRGGLGQLAADISPLGGQGSGMETHHCLNCWSAEDADHIGF
nr:hypothetical protein 10 [Desulfobulbaceae bacterium]